VKSYALSTLQQQRLTLGERFRDRYPNDWLVWEPGAWNVPKGTAAGSRTVPPRQAGHELLRDDDPLCFMLEPKPDGSASSVGRAEGNDLVLSDETVSRNHCFLVHTGSTWVVSCDTQARELDVNGDRLPPGDSAPLRSGQRLLLGHVVLTLLSTRHLVERLDGKR
jgi:hypothetical protein